MCQTCEKKWQICGKKWQISKGKTNTCEKRHKLVKKGIKKKIESSEKKVPN